MKTQIRIAIAALALVPLGSFAQTLAPSQDAYYVAGNATNTGTATTITVGQSGAVGLVQFDLTQLPGGVTSSQIQKATLTLFLDHVGTGGTINVDTVSASTPWGELTVNGNSGISTGSAVGTGVTAATTDTFISMDATAAVQGWITTPSSNNGFMILGNGGTSVQFDSKENTSTSHPATLTIIIASSGPSGPTGVTGPTGTNGTNGANGTNGTNGGTGPTGPAGPTGPTGTNGTNGSNGATGATGAAGGSSSGIPLRIGGNSGAAIWNTPGGNQQQASLSAELTTIAPIACTPILTVWSYAGAAITWTLISVTPSTSSATWSAGSTVISCSTTSTAGNSCTATGSTNQVSEGTILILTTSTQTAPSGGGFLSSFSCQNQ